MLAFCIITDSSDWDLSGAVYEARTYGSVRATKSGNYSRLLATRLPSQTLIKTDPEGTQTYYIYGLGLIGEEKDGVYRSYHYDFRGSTVALTDDSGAVTDRYSYGPYGELYQGVGVRQSFNCQNLPCVNSCSLDAIIYDEAQEQMYNTEKFCVTG